MLYGTKWLTTAERVSVSNGSLRDDRQRRVTLRDPCRWMERRFEMHTPGVAHFLD